MKKSLLIITLLFIQNIYAAPSCPPVSRIQGVPLKIEEPGSFNFVATSVDTFGTEDYWKFTMPIDGSRSKSEAESIAARILPTLRFISGPTHYVGNIYNCQYQTSYGPATAVAQCFHTAVK